MEYSLAKELKDAGFPLEWRKHRGRQDEITPPTLSQLIEACGEGFHGLEKYKLRWTASGCRFPDIQDTAIAEGPTPKIAVAKLWLALNQPPQRK